MSTARNSSSWTVSRTSSSSIRRASPAPSKARASRALASENGAIDEEADLLRAADLIGQLGDPNYIRKANALYHEFEEAGLNRQLGYDSPADLVNKYPQFYWNSVAQHVQTAIRYLNVTASGRQWIANLYSQRLPRRARHRAERAAEIAPVCVPEADGRNPVVRLTFARPLSVGVRQQGHLAEAVAGRAGRISRVGSAPPPPVHSASELW